MSFTTYENRANPHITIHINSCNQIRKNGGEHKYGNGEYHEFQTYQEAKIYTKTTKLPIKDCYFCKPQKKTSYFR